MSPNRAAELLQVTGPLPAVDVANRLRISLQRAYGLLVAAEALGLVRINVDSAEQSFRTWEAMRDEYADA